MQASKTYREAGKLEDELKRFGNTGQEVRETWFWAKCSPYLNFAFSKHNILYKAYLINVYWID